MSVWMSESEFRQGGAASLGVTINVPFLQEIKQDFEFRQLLKKAQADLSGMVNDDDSEPHSPRIASELLSNLRDEMETYFALEEFYGYFEQSAESNPAVSKKAIDLRTEHEKLYLQFNEIVEVSEQIVYHECSPDVTIKELSTKLDLFCEALGQHENNEMDLMMRMCNEDIGVGD